MCASPLVNLERATVLGKNAERCSSVTSDALLIKSIQFVTALGEIHPGHLQKLLHPTSFAIL